jgi:NDP-4-keto-2,6-dideoxyhexose 3-C-methyltransferase
MFYDIENPNKFMKEVSSMLENNGIWILEMSYFPLLLKQLTYDQICHEHVTYYTLTVFKKIANKNNLKIIDVDFNDINGGSIEIICTKKNSTIKENVKKINRILDDEKKINKQSYINFNNRVENIKSNLINFLNICKKAKLSVIGYGAATKGNVVLNHCNITSTHLPYICDGNTDKYGKFTPGTNINIISKEKMRKLNPDYLLVLIWSFKKEVIRQEIKYILKGGKLVFHLPMFHVVDKKNYKYHLKEDFKFLSYSL